MTLREVWERAGYRSAASAARGAGINTATIYRMLRKEPAQEKCKLLLCVAFYITLAEYEALEPEETALTHKHNHRQYPTFPYPPIRS